MHECRFVPNHLTQDDDMGAPALHSHLDRRGAGSTCTANLIAGVLEEAYLGMSSSFTFEEVKEN